MGGGWDAGGFASRDAACSGGVGRASAQMYPEFVHELEDESRLKIDLRAWDAACLRIRPP